MEKVVSGIRPTGNLHLGNYFGAVKSFVKMQDEYESLFFIADWHSLTTSPKPEDIQRSARVILAEYLACGIDPQKAKIYVQSDVKETLELYLFFNMNMYLGELERVTTFKDKARQQPDNVNAGLLTYPTLMAADILQHRAHKVPVGKDQEQNMEMARKCARRFNHIYGVDLFPEPQNFYFNTQAVKVPGLDGSGKMGKSDGNCIYLYEDDAAIRAKVMKAVTDIGPQAPNSPKPKVIENLFTFLRICSVPEAYSYFDEKWNDCSIRYGDLKKQIAEDIIKTVTPIRERIMEYRSNTQLLDRIAQEGAEVARASASATLKEVRKIIGFR
ncbi:tryptophan--tRNA ligase [Hoylesella shahii]|uniref:tryptophan--tRNA ligase n=1 Tax=Hoylesella shahii TaxID=228603 RepID=UPI001CB203B3|nr:tryptophan--tRNA ligase [Hoylesella shahii]MBF1577310.1 tryptophan--tRNA ligase [Hoylesella shahii]